jgi:hypothetical protein
VWGGHQGRVMLSPRPGEDMGFGLWSELDQACCLGSNSLPTYRDLVSSPLSLGLLTYKRGQGCPSHKGQAELP